MRLGVNVTSPTNFPIALALVEAGHAHFCEVLIDNFLHLDGGSLLSSFKGVPVAFHIMNSRFVERDEASLDEMAARLRRLIADVEPIYVSDHLARFTERGRQLPMLLELDGVRDLTLACRRVAVWQERLGQRLFLENFPSVLGDGNAQATFYGHLIAETGCGVLFDFSNAVVAELNTGYAARNWLPIIETAEHFHAAGYRRSESTPALVIDSHDGPVAPDTLAFIADFERRRGGCAGITLVVERDANIAFDAWAADLQAVGDLHA